MNQVVELRDVVEQTQSGFACGETDESGIIQLRMNNLDTEGFLDLTHPRRVPTSAVRDLDGFSLRAGDVVFNNTNSPALVGKSACFMGHSEPVVFSNHFTRLRPRRDRLDARYLAGWLQAQWRMGVFIGLCNQWVNQAAVRRDALLGLRLSLPPLPEQRRIADLLDRADAIRRKRKQALALTDALLRSTFLDMFGDPIGNPKGWPVATLHRLGGKFKYGTNVRCTAEPRTPDVPVLRIPNVAGGKVQWDDLKYATLGEAELERLRLHRADILFVRSNGNPEFIGRCAVVDDDRIAAYASYLIRLRLPAGGVEPAYVQAALSTDSYRAFLTRGARTTAGNYNVSAETLKDLRLPVPPCSLQEQFVVACRRIAEIRARYESANADADHLASSLAAAAFQPQAAQAFAK